MTQPRGHPRTRPALRDGEGGFVIVYVLALLVIALVIGTAALSEALSARDLTTHDMRQRRAQQSAEAGVAAALYSAREANFGAAYNFTGGVLGLGTFLDCAVPQLNINLQVVGVTAYASSAGVCPQALTNGGVGTTSWSAQGNHSYYQSEYLTNKQEQGGTGAGGVVEFPQVVSIGCDGTSAANCKNGASTNIYSRELVNMSPTGPLQTVEGIGNVTMNGLTALGIHLAVTINGDISAGGTLTLPLLGIALNSNVGNLASLLGLTGIIPTFTASGFNVSITTAHEVTSSGTFCTAGSPSTTCTIKRQPVTPAVTTCSACASISAPVGAYNATKDTFTMSSGTATFPPGDYVFCNFNVTGGTVTAPSPTTGPVRIFILPPNSAPCNSAGYGNNFTETGGVWNGGNFVDTAGASNALTGAVNGVSGAVDPSGFQVYVQGDGGYDNSTSVTFGNSASLTENAIIYAPTSNVTVNSNVAFVGSVVGDTVTINSPVVTQDLDVGNFPLYSGVNGVQPTQYIGCDTSKTSLVGGSADYSGC